MRPPLVLAVVLFSAPGASAQGTVQARDQRRPPPLTRSERCELWEGTVSGNDPTAQASMQVCALEGGRVRGVFLWSSLQSGWDRRAFEGAWSADGATLTLRDTHMIESHPMNGWMLCTADRYLLRRVAPTRLEGSYDSSGCSDHGTMAFVLRGEGELPSPPGEPTVDRPARAAASGRRAGCGCTVPRRRDQGSLAGVAALLGIALGLSRRAARRR